MANWNEETFFQNLDLENGRQVFGDMVTRMAPYYSRDQIQEQLWFENRGRNNVDSPVGAMGAPQIMPATLKGLQRNNPHRGYTDPRDPAQGLQMYEDLMMENYRRAKKEGLSDQDASIKGVRTYHGGWDMDDWGPDNREYNAVVNFGTTSKSLAGLNSESMPGPTDLYNSPTSPIEYPNVVAQNAYSKGMEKDVENIKERLENPMIDFTDVLEAQKSFAPGLYNTFMGYVNNTNGRG